MHASIENAQVPKRRVVWWLVPASILLGAACQGVIEAGDDVSSPSAVPSTGDRGAGADPGRPAAPGGDPGPAVGAPSSAGVACGPAALLPARVVRLASSEVRAQLEAVFTPPVVARAGWIALEGDHVATVEERPVSAADFSSFQATARALARTFVSGSTMGPCSGDGQEGACWTETLQPLVERLYRRALRPEEARALADGHRALASAHGPAAAAEGVVLSALLSAQTLFRTEGLELSGSGGVARLSPREAAEAASFALLGRWEPTMTTAVSGTSGTELSARLSAQAAGWTRSEAFRARMTDFLERWVGADHLTEVDRVDPIFDDALKEAMRTELRDFAATHLFGPEAAFESLFLGQGTRYVKGMEKVYGKAAVEGDRVRWDGTGRKGLLGLPGLLAAHAGPQGSDPVQRGVFVRIGLLCEPMPPPDPNADLDTIQTTESMQTRERFEALAAAAGCAVCHQVINPPGYLFESFDHLGRHRTMEKGRAIDDTGSLPPFFGREPYEGVGAWRGIAPLADWLARAPEVRQCFATRFVSYVLAQEIPKGIENCAIDRLSQRFVRTGKLSDLVEDVFVSELFLSRAHRPAMEVR
jgi:hypothetical protein